MLKPYDLATLNTQNSERRRLVEIISKPFPGEDGEEHVMVRMVPGEPTTMEEVSVGSLIPAPRRKYLHVARVNSTFSFPEDMLRYDCAALYDYRIPEDNVPRSELSDILVYRVSDYKASPWTVARWNSFSCSIRPVLTRKLGSQ